MTAGFVDSVTKPISSKHLPFPVQHLQHLFELSCDGWTQTDFSRTGDSIENVEKRQKTSKNDENVEKMSKTTKKRRKKCQKTYQN